jgi:hypothetical protein
MLTCRCRRLFVVPVVEQSSTPSHASAASTVLPTGSVMAKSLADLIASESPIAPPRPAAEVPVNDFDILDRGEYTWAKDVDFVYNNQTTSLKQAKSWSPGRQGLLKVLKSDSTHFMSIIMPKAISLLEKARGKMGDDVDVIRKERREISALQSLLRDAIDEAARLK